MQQTENDILKRVRKIEIKTRGLSNEIFAGKYHTAFRGRGMSFSEVREYRAGDDVRDIDWNVTARSRKPHIKVYEEERELTMMLVVDVSASRMFGTTERLKKNIITEIAAVLAFSASQNNDKVGCIFFSDRIEKFIPPKKGRSHILTIIRELVGFRPESRGTKLSEPIRFLTNVNKKRCTTFILSDFMDSSADREALDDALKIAQGKHDLVGIRVCDPREAELPDVGIVELRDAETGRKVWVDTSSRAVREHYAATWRRRSDEIDAAARDSILGSLELLDRSLGALDATSAMRSASRTMKDTADQEWDKLEEETRFLSIDPSAKKRSFTSEKNQEPDTLQIILRTEEISLDDTKELLDAETEKEEMSPLSRMWNVLVKIWNAIVEIFKER